jgi:hypothetical protein
MRIAVFVCLALIGCTDTRTGPARDGGALDRDDAQVSRADGASGDPDGGAPGPLGGDVLVFQGEGAMPIDSGQYLIDGIEELTLLYAGLGADVVVSETWPADASPFRLAIWHQPGAGEAATFTVSQPTLDAIQRWLGRGGRIVIAGDVDGEFGGYSLTNANRTIDDVLVRLGVSIRITATLGGLECVNDPGHPLMQSGATVSWYAANALEIAAPAHWLYCSALAIQEVGGGEVVVIGDVNPVSDRPDFADQLLRNFYSVPTAVP